jgi:hypothetical protein
LLDKGARAIVMSMAREAFKQIFAEDTADDTAPIVRPAGTLLC